MTLKKLLVRHQKDGLSTFSTTRLGKAWELATSLVLFKC